MALPVHVLHSVKVRLKSVSNEGHFTLAAETVFRPYLPAHSSGVTEICHMVHPAHALRAVQVWLKSVSKEEHFTLEAQTVRITHRVTVECVKYPTLHSQRMLYDQSKLGCSRSVMKGTLL
jgi:hypothetical protein